MNNVLLPAPKIQARIPRIDIEQEAIRNGLHPLLARILSTRPLPSGLKAHELLSLKLNDLEQPYNMLDMAKAAKRVAQAIINKEVIGVETDHDCDGQTSHAVLYHNLTQHFQHPADKLRSYIGHRLTEGYGLSAAVAARILASEPRPSLLITADNGSADEPRIKQLAAAGIEVIVTDHHMVPVANEPVSAYAFLNPTRDDCRYSDKYIAGCMVAWLLMAATRQELINLNYLPAQAPKLLDSLDFVAVGTIADCVSIARSKNNRPVVAYGLTLIAKGVRPCWRALRPLLNSKSSQISAEDVAFKIAPLLNSDGRLSSAFGSVNFLLTTTDTAASAQVAELQQQNQQRKAIQHDITQRSIAEAAALLRQRKFSICIYLEHGHVGVHGISASKLKERFGRPTAIFAQKFAATAAPAINVTNTATDQLISGSIRAIDNFHVRNALQFIAEGEPSLMLAYGGHQGAGGVTIKLADFSRFAELFEQAATLQLTETDLGPVIWTDGELPAHWINLDILATISQLEPFGREFEPPVFEGIATVNAINVIGDGTHARINLLLADQAYRGVWFNMRDNAQAAIPVVAGDRVKVAFSLRLNEFGGMRNCELQIHALQRLG